MIQPNRRAAGAMILASAFLALSTFLAKGAAGQFDIASATTAMHPLQVTAGRFLFGFLVWVLVIAVRSGVQGQPSVTGTIHWRLHIARSSFGWLTVSCLFWAAALMPLTDATAISFLNPVFAMFFASVLLKEVVGRDRILPALIMLFGAMVLLRPGSAVFQPAAIIALGAAVAGAIEALLVKRQTQLEPRLQILLLNNAIGAAIAFVAASMVWVWPNPLQWLVLAGVGFSMAATQLLFLTSLRIAATSFVMPFVYATLLFASVLDYAFFGDAPDALGVIGAIIIVVGAILLSRAAPSQ
jgi:drug/metabolite transporter (DMT)-like permease